MVRPYSNCCGSCNCPLDNELNVRKANFEFYDDNSFVSGVVEFSAAVDFIYGILSNDIFEKLNGSHSDNDKHLHFCSSCGKLLELCYVAHKNFESVINPQSVLRELIKHKDRNKELHSIKSSSEPTEYRDDPFSDFCNNNKDRTEPDEEQIDIKYDPLDSAVEASECIDDIKSRLRNRKVLVKVERISEENIAASKLTNERKSKRISRFADNLGVSKVKNSVEGRGTKKCGSNGKKKGKWKCPTCEKVFTDFNYYKYKHLRVHTNDKMPRHLCHLCGKDFIKRSYLKTHYLLKHAPAAEKLKKMEECKICRKLIFSPNMKTHVKAHGKTPAPKTIRKCDHCEKEYTSLEYLNDHIERVHTDSSFPCEVCGIKKPSQISLHRHMINHAPKLFACDQCPKTFTHNGRLQTHKATTHATVRSLICEECGKTFKYPNHFVVHLKMHREVAERGPRSVQCDECGKYFKHSLSLHKHKFNMHREKRNQKIHKCSFCGKMLSGAIPLRNHEDLHRNDVNFKPRKYREGQRMPSMSNELSLDTNEEY